MSAGIPEALGWDRKEYDVHLLYHILVWYRWTYSLNVVGEEMVLEVIRVAVMEIKVFCKAGTARPDKDLVVTIAEMVCKTTAKVSCSENENA